MAEIETMAEAAAKWRKLVVELGASGNTLTADELTERFYALRAERDRLQAFKDYAHKRLDDAGVPVDPESSHRAEGCRIGGRLDLVLAKWTVNADLLAACKALLIRMEASVYRVGGDQEVYRLWWESMEKARDAITKAEPQ